MYIVRTQTFSENDVFFSPSLCFIIIIMEHDDNNEGIYNINREGERPRYHLSVRLPRVCVCVCVCESYAEKRMMNRRRRKSVGDRYQNSSRARGDVMPSPRRCGGRRDWIPEGRVINPRAKYAKIPAGEFITWLRQ